MPALVSVMLLYLISWRLHAYSLELTLLHQNMPCGCLLKLPHQGNSRKYQKGMFWCKTKIFLILPLSGPELEL